MSQDVFSDINPDTTSGTELATLLNSFKAALLTCLIGTTRPSEIGVGGLWIDNTDDPTWKLKVYVGSSTDITLITIDTSNLTPSITGADFSFTITKTSADAVSPILELVKSRIANSGKVLSGDVIGTIHGKSTDNVGGQSVVGRIKFYANQDHTTSQKGTDIIIEQVSASSTTLSEVARFVSGLLGIGTTAPSTPVHAVGTGVTSQAALSDNTTEAKFIAKKKRVANSGKVLSGDSIGAFYADSTDDTGANINAFKMVALAVENHTTTSHGTRVAFSVKKTAATAFTEILSLGDDIIFKTSIAKAQTVDSSTSGSSVTIDASASSHIKVTNGSLSSIAMISGPVDGKILTLINGTGASITVKDQTGATANRQIITTTGADVIMPNNSVFQFIHDSASSKWRLITRTPELANVAAQKFYGGPLYGVSATLPAFRTIDYTDIPSRNVLLNSLATINQRPAVGTATNLSSLEDTSKFYFIDRWRANVSSLTSSQATVLVDTASPDRPSAFNYGYSMHIAATATNASARLIIQQELDTQDSALMRGRYFTFWAYVKSNTASSRLFLLDGINVYVSNAHSGGGGWELLYAQGTISTSTTQVIATLRVATAANGNTSISSGDYAKMFGPVLSEGTIQPNPHNQYSSEQEELRRCRAFFYNWVNDTNQYAGVGQAFAINDAGAMMYFPSTMRTAPTILWSGTNAHFEWLGSSGTASDNSKALTFNSASKHMVLVGGGPSSGLTAGNSTALRSKNASARLSANAEI